MTSSTAIATPGRTHWKRFALVLLIALVLAAALIAMVGKGVVAASFAVSGQSFKVSADRLAGTGFEQFGSIDRGKSGGPHPVAPAAIRDAKLTNMCQSVKTSTPFGPVTLRITAGGGSTPATASRLVVDLDQLNGDASFTNINIGQDASTLSQVPGVTGAPGSFGQQSDTITIDHLTQQAWAVTAGTFRLSGLGLRVGFNEHECF